MDVRDQEVKELRTQLKKLQLENNQLRQAPAVFQDEEKDIAALLAYSGITETAYPVVLRVFFKTAESLYSKANVAGALSLGFIDVNSIVGLSDNELFSPAYVTHSVRIEEDVRKTSKPSLNVLEYQDFPESPPSDAMAREPGWVITSRYPWIDEKGDFQGTIVLSYDASHLTNYSSIFGGSIVSTDELELLRRNRRAVAGANEGMWERDLETDQIQVSERWRDMLGITSNDPIYLDDLLRLIAPDYRDQIELKVVAHTNGETERYECEYPIMHTDGRYRWVYSRGQTSINEFGKPVLSGSHTDITRRKEAEHRTEEEQKEAQQLFDINKSLIFVKDKNFRFRRANHALELFYGVNREKLIGSTDEEIGVATKSQCARFREYDEKIFAGKVDEIEIIEDIRGADGRIGWFHTVKRPLQTTNGLLLMGVATDITDFVEKKQTLQAIMDMAPVAIHFKNIDGEYVDVNPEFLKKAEVIGRSQVIGKMSQDLFPPELSQEIKKMDAEVIEGTDEVVTFTHECRVGSEKRIFQGSKVCWKEGGHIKGIIGVSLDVTERQKEVEINFHRKRLDILQSLLTSLKHDFVCTFLAIVDQEASKITEFEQFIEQRAEWCKMLKFARDYIIRLQWIVSPDKNSPQEFKPERKYYLARTLSEQAARWADKARPKPECIIEAAADLEVFCDEDLLLALLYNFIHNAKRFTPGEKVHEPVVVKASRLTIDGKTGVMISVDDGGDGLPRNVSAESLFDLGESFDPGKISVKGTGFGLYFCRRIIECHPGAILSLPTASDRGGALFRAFIPEK